MVVVYRKKNFTVYSNLKHGFIIHNTHKPFEIGHTHINNFNTAKYIINIALHKSVPYHTSNYILESITRVSEDENYINTIKSLYTKKRYKENSI